MESQTLLILILFVLALNLTFVGVYLVLVLREVRSSAGKFNRLLDTVNAAAEAIAKPVMNTAAALEDWRANLRIVNLLQRLLAQRTKEKEVSEGKK
jgi:hypothetical protein